MTSRDTVNLPVIMWQPGMFRMVSPIRSSPRADFLRSCLLDSRDKRMCGPITPNECASVSMFHADTVMFHVKNTQLIRGLDWVNGQHVSFSGLSILSAANRVWLAPEVRLMRYACQNRLNLLPFGSLSLAVAVFGEAPSLPANASAGSP